MSATKSFFTIYLLVAGSTVSASTARADTPIGLPIESLLSWLYDSIEDDATQDLRDGVQKLDAGKHAALSIHGQWAGSLLSAASGMERQLDATFALPAIDDPSDLAGALSFVEQGNVYQFRPLKSYVGQDGRVRIVALATTAYKIHQPAQTLIFVMDANYLTASRFDENGTSRERIEGVYQVYAVDGNGIARLVDQGVLGIIAILIG